MNMIELLSDSYVGDEAWQRFVQCFKADWTTFPDNNLLVSKTHDEEIAVVLSGLLGVHSFNWLDSRVPALDNNVPVEVLANYPDGKIIIRAFLMRMP